MWAIEQEKYVSQIRNESASQNPNITEIVRLAARIDEIGRQEDLMKRVTR